jgi:hypothetical protein
VSNMTRKKRIISSGVAIIVLVVAGLVYAAWTTSGSGSGYTKATEAQELTTDDVSATTVGQLYPGGNGDVKIKINNPNPYPVLVTDVTRSGAITADATGCTTTGVSFADQTNKTIEIAANGNTSVTFNNAASMSNASNNACQGATFTIPVDLAGRSNAS